jgi:hypothetical protein
MVDVEPDISACGVTVERQFVCSPNENTDLVASRHDASFVALADMRLFLDTNVMYCLLSRLGITTRAARVRRQGKLVVAWWKRRMTARRRLSFWIAPTCVWIRGSMAWKIHGNVRRERHQSRHQMAGRGEDEHGASPRRTRSSRLGCVCLRRDRYRHGRALVSPSSFESRHWRSARLDRAASCLPTASVV